MLKDTQILKASADHQNIRVILGIALHLWQIGVTDPRIGNSIANLLFRH